MPDHLQRLGAPHQKGDHDELTSREALIASGAISEELYDRAAAMGARLFAEGQRWAASRG